MYLKDSFCLARSFLCASMSFGLTGCDPTTRNSKALGLGVTEIVIPPDGAWDLARDCSRFNSSSSCVINGLMPGSEALDFKEDGDGSNKKEKET